MRQYLPSAAPKYVEFYCIAHRFGGLRSLEVDASSHVFRTRQAAEDGLPALHYLAQVGF